MANPFAEEEASVADAAPSNPFAQEEEPAPESGANPFEDQDEPEAAADSEAVDPEAAGKVEEEATAIVKTVSGYSVETQQDRRFQNADVCAVCSAALGKRWMRPRHHCRVCSQSVCASCSPSTIQLMSEGLQRTCKTCIEQMLEMTELKAQLARLAEDLSSMTRGENPGDEGGRALMATCEEAVSQLLDLQAGHQAASTQVEVLKQQLQEVREAQSSALQAAEARCTEEAAQRLAAEAAAEAAAAERHEMEAKLHEEEKKRKAAEAEAQSFSVDLQELEAETLRLRELQEKAASERMALEVRLSESLPRHLAGTSTPSSHSVAEHLVQTDPPQPDRRCSENCKNSCSIA
ncbi:unnamed protein product [Durusdinium trenchii]|uniref:FYVE-type domain-containing protein n=1 Tax=Durusdinium trenchii TaxID=1381693 RepID=A0ABP0K3R7_9DINO